MAKLAIVLLLTLAACGGTPPPTQQQVAQAQQDQRSLEIMLNVSSQACLRGIDLGCRFVTSYEYCMEGVPAACANARVYGRMILTAAAS